jgi:hypothetical protein
MKKYQGYIFLACSMLIFSNSGYSGRTDKGQKYEPTTKLEELPQKESIITPKERELSESLPDNNAALIKLYKTKNNGLDVEKCNVILKKAIEKMDRGMVETSLKPPLQERSVGNKDNPKPDAKTRNIAIKHLDRDNSNYLDIWRALEEPETPDGPSPIEKATINHMLIEEAKWFKSDICLFILRREPDQAAIDSALLVAAVDNPYQGCSDDDFSQKKYLIKLLIDSNPSQEGVDKAFKKFLLKASDNKYESSKYYPAPIARAFFDNININMNIYPDPRIILETLNSLSDIKTKFCKAVSALPEINNSEIGESVYFGLRKALQDSLKKNQCSF